MLVAGVGNIFLGDDGFGVAVANQLLREPLPEWVRVADFGIRGIHLAYELMDQDYDLTVLVDAVPRGGRPGTLYLIEPALSQAPPSPPANAHGMNPEAVFAIVKTLGGQPGRVLVVGCEPACTQETMTFSEEVRGAIEEAVGMVRELIDRFAHSAT